jgi:parallel beta-helix repeat protein
MGTQRAVLLLSVIICFAVVSIPEIGVVKAEGAIYIRADGSVEGTDKIQRDGDVYTLKGNLVSEFESYYGLTIEADNIILDGAGFTLQGSGNGIGIYLPTLTPDEPGRSNVTIKNLQINGFNTGIKLRNSTNNAIIGCTTNSIELFASNNNTITGNNFGTILLTAASKHNSIISNDIANSRYGIKIEWSPTNIFRYNSIINCTYPLMIDDCISTDEDWIQFIDSSNTIDGKLIYYLVNRNDEVFEASDFPEVRYLAFVNCTRITVENLTLVDVLQGIILVQTTNSTITNNTVADNWYGVNLLRSFDNTIIGNNVTNNSCGIFLNGPSNNTIIGNSITANNDGIRFDGCSNNTIIGNTLTNNKRGIYLYVSPNNTIVGNLIQNNSVGLEFGSLYTRSSDNLIYSNNLIGNVNQVVYSYVLWGAGASNIWDNGTTGNYWSNYNGTDNDGDGVGDTPYVINENNQDNYPLIVPVNISAIPEFPSWLILLLFLTASLVAIFYSRRVRTYLRHF